MNLKLISIILVAVVIAGGAAAVVVTKNGDTQEPDGSVGRLAIYGNADNNDSLDDRDLDRIQDVIDGKAPSNKLCDANHDGAVDSGDLTQVRGLLAGKKSTVHYIDANGDHQTVEWPVKRASVLFRSVQQVALAAGMSYPTVVSYQVADPILFKSFEGAEVLSKLPMGGSADRLGQFEYLTNARPDVIVVGQGIDDPTDQQRRMYKDAGIDLVVVASMSGKDSIDSVLTLGFICGDLPTAQRFARWCDGMLSDIESKVASIPESERKSAYIWYGGGVIAGKNDEYMKAFELAGGANRATWEVASISNDNKSWLLNNDMDYMLRVFTVGYGASEDKMSELYDRFIPMIDKNRFYKEGNYWLIDFSMPQILRVAYMAEIVNPDVFGQGYADGWHQELLEIFGIEDFKVDGQFTYNRPCKG